MALQNGTHLTNFCSKAESNRGINNTTYATVSALFIIKKYGGLAFEKAHPTKLFMVRIHTTCTIFLSFFYGLASC